MGHLLVGLLGHREQAHLLCLGRLPVAKWSIGELIGKFVSYLPGAGFLAKDRGVIDAGVAYYFFGCLFDDGPEVLVRVSHGLPVCEDEAPLLLPRHRLAF